MSNDTLLHEALSRCLGKRLTFAAFRAPGMPITIWAQREPGVETVDGRLLWELNDVFLVAPFELDPAHIAMIRSDVDLSFGEFGSDISALFECRGDERPPMPVEGEGTGQKAYTDAVVAAKAGIAAGRMTKVVLSRTRVARMPEADLIPLFLRACLERPRAFVALVRTPGSGLWLGASPERLILAQEDHVRVDALAGTMPAGAVPDSADAWGAKERDEQRIVTEAVMAALRSVGAVHVMARDPETLLAGEVAHLRTRVEADLGAVPLSDLVLALHPTPAVCGAPREAAREFIRNTEEHDRGLYTGFWGPWSADGRTELYVNIRCLRHGVDHALIYAGAGITAGSDPRLEWEETEQKTRIWARPVADVDGTGSQA
ncbi:MAG: chorismate-binding protein [Bacteroidetes bacterium]|nr:chorismate-binding protein [Bacteroidota bacterium]